MVSRWVRFAVRLVPCILAMLLAVSFWEASEVMAASGAPVPADGVYVYDDADLFPQKKEGELEAYLGQLGKEAGVGIYVLTSDDSGNGTSDKYSEDFYDAGYDRGTIPADAVILHIDMEERYVNIQAYGRAEDKIPDAKGERIIDAMYDDLRGGSYYNACRTYARKVKYYMEYVPFYLKAWFHLIIALAIGGISVGSMVSASSGKMEAGASSYTDHVHTGLRARRDDYLRTSVTRRKKPQSNSSSGSRGGGGGHYSGGGHSHSSAGRHF